MRHRVPIVVVVANNQGTSGARKQLALFPKKDSQRVTMFQPRLEYDRILTLFGGQGTTITNPELLKPTLGKLISAGTPACVNVMIDPDAPLPSAWGEPSSNEGARQ